MGMQKHDAPAWVDALTDGVLGSAIEVHRTLGPGLLEKVYETALCHELDLRGIPFERQRPIAVRYKAIDIPGQRLDLVVGSAVVVELKAADAVSDTHLAQLVSYLRSGGFPAGLLINFNVPALKSGIYRRINPDAFSLAPPPRSHSALSASGSAPSAFCIPE